MFCSKISKKICVKIENKGCSIYDVRYNTDNKNEDEIKFSFSFERLKSL